MQRDLTMLRTVLEQIRKDFGQDSIFFGQSMPPIDVRVVSTGSLALDLATGIGGFPRGRSIEIFGEESSGKSTLALQAIAEVQKLGGVAALVDTEYSIDPTWAKKIGVNFDDLIIVQPSYGEEGFRIIETLLRANSVDMIVVDSLAAMAPQDLMEADIGDKRMGAHARMVSEALQKLSSLLARSETILILTNQMRENIGNPYAPRDKTPGGNAPKYYTSMRIRLSKSNKPIVDKNGQPIGTRIRAKILKNKLSIPYREADLTIDFVRGGFSKAYEVLDFGVQLGILVQKGSYYYYNGTKIAQGEQNMIEALYNDPSLMQTLEAQIRAVLFQSTGTAVATAEARNDGYDASEES